jgi:hypothetical protein
LLSQFSELLLSAPRSLCQSFRSLKALWAFPSPLRFPFHNRRPEGYFSSAAQHNDKR